MFIFVELISFQFLGWLDRSIARPSIFLEVVTAHSGLISLTASHVIFRSASSIFERNSLSYCLLK